MFLLDTMVLSEGFRIRPTPSVVQWFQSIDPASAFVSVVTFGEIEAGIEKQRRAEAAFLHIEEWLDETRVLYKARTLPITTAIAMRWGRMITQLHRRYMDIFIAATALEHDLTVVTRNIRHFEPTSAKLLNPYES